MTYDYFPWMDHTATIVAAQAKFMERIVEWAVKLAKRYGEELLA